MPKSSKKINVRNLLESLKEEVGLYLHSGAGGLDRRITAAEINRPGLALTGWYKYFAKHRLQVLGKVELYYLKSLSSERHTEIIRELMKMRIPAFIVARNYKPLPETVALSNEYNVPVLRSPMVTMRLVNKLSAWLEDTFASSTHVHGTLMEVHGVGVLIMGKAGVGKSECALSLVERGHILVCDDVISVKVTEGSFVTGFANEKLGHHMEIRGVGIINVQSLYGVKSIRMWKHIDFVVTLEPWREGEQYDRLGMEQEFKTILGVSLPNVTIPVKPGRDIALLIETAAQTFKLKDHGFDVARAFNQKLLATMKLPQAKSRNV
jgi:HPr kinase/phosphorylase